MGGGRFAFFLISVGGQLSRAVLMLLTLLLMVRLLLTTRPLVFIRVVVVAGVIWTGFREQNLNKENNFKFIMYILTIPIEVVIPSQLFVLFPVNKSC